MKSKLIQVNDHGKIYQVLEFVCPGCVSYGSSGIHILPVNTVETSPSWTWNEDLERPTIQPSILTNHHSGHRCHSFLRDGVFEFLSDCSHELAGTSCEIPDLPDWAAED